MAIAKARHTAQAPAKKKKKKVMYTRQKNEASEKLAVTNFKFLNEIPLLLVHLGKKEMHLWHYREFVNARL